MTRSLRLASLLLALILPLFSATAQQKPARRPAASQATGASAKDSRTVAVVNGQTIPYKYYEDLYNDQINYQLRNGGTNVVAQEHEDALFLQLIDAELIRQEAAKRNVRVTRDQAIQALLENPPDFIQDAFVDGKGIFQKDIFRQVVLHPEMIGRIASPGRDQNEVIAQWKADLDKVIVYVQTRETRRQLADKLYAAKPLTADQIRRRYITERTLFNGSFIRVLNTTIPDSLVPVTDRQARAWYDSHLDDYRFASARQVAAMLMPVAPSSADSVDHYRQIIAARASIAQVPVAQRSNVVTQVSQGLPRNRFPNTPVNILQVPKEVRDSLRAAKIGDVIGPFSFEKEDVLFFIEDTVSTHDTVIHARHILIKVKPGDIGEDTTTRNLMTVMRGNITSDSLFEVGVKFYSQDGSAQRGGDLGYFGHGTMVPEFDSAAYSAPVGVAVGPVRSRFGYHLIWVKERVTTGYKIRELRFPFGASASAIETAKNDAVAYARALRANTASDSLYYALKGKYPGTVVDTSIIHRLDIYGDALAPADFAFNADSGDVGVFPLPYDRLMIAKVIFSYPTGIAPYEKIRMNFVVPNVQREHQLDMLAPRMKALADTMTPEMTLGNIRLSAPWAEAFMVHEQYLTSPPDEDTLLLDSCMEAARDSSVTGPVRGKNGYYFLRVVKKIQTPTAADFARDRIAYTREFTDRYREKLLTEMLAKAREYAVVEDRRPGAIGSSQ
jgi:parvulin-like peptidyl-prolyl isomerase